MDARYPQFQLRGLFLATLCASVFVSLCTGTSHHLVFIAIFAGMVIYSVVRNIGWLCVFSLVGILATSFLWERQSTERRERHLAVCHANLNRIAEALKAYRAEYGSYPPVSLCDRSGTPAHSWRILLLPYLGYRGLYERYSFAEPWDGPRNKAIIGEVVDVFACPAQIGNSCGATNYLAVAFLEDATAPAQHRGSDGQPLAQHVPLGAVIEIGDSHLHWMSPHDTRYARSQILPATAEHKAEWRGHSNDTIHVLYADGMLTHPIQEKVEELVRASLAEPSNN